MRVSTSYENHLSEDLTSSSDHDLLPPADIFRARRLDESVD